MPAYAKPKPIAAGPFTRQLCRISRGSIATMRVFIALGGSHFLVSLCLAQVPSPDYNIGDWWVFNLHGTGDARTQYRETISTVELDHIVVTTEKGGKRTYSQRMNPLDATRSEIPLVTFPLEVGKKWAAKIEWKNGTFYGVNSMKYEVVAKEEVVVPAGKFEAYRIEGFGFVDDKVANWGPVGGQPKVVEVFWYAPAVKRVVKYDNKNLKWIPPQFVETYSRHHELAEYQLQ